ncbi:MAG: hypothetical protein JWN99_80, partial [Ilumatobacteraceae bacterium]|nr:hypothetical protein [Ilumatobacteraceae bacterium]
MTGLPQQAYAASLAGFEKMSVHRLLALLRHHSPQQAFAIATGMEPPPPGGLLAEVVASDGVLASWQADALRRPPAQVWQQCVDLGIQVSVLGDAAHPVLLMNDP